MQHRMFMLHKYVRQHPTMLQSECYPYLCAWKNSTAMRNACPELS